MRPGAALVIIITGVLQAAGPAWLNTVAPIITGAEKRAYLGLPQEDRSAFEEKFWSARSIERDEYYRRLDYIDLKFGSSKRGSGANTDCGRVYLSLGAPAKITRVPSSRIFVPLEIWYYDSVPGYLNTELRLIFYQPNGTGIPKLYSPTVDTLRLLLLPEASAVHMFGPNDGITESDIRRNLKTGPAEEEVITAAIGVASGIKYSGNDEILGQIVSPEFMLTKARHTQVSTRFITSHPPLDIVRTPSPFGGSQVDLRFLAAAQKDVGIEVLQGFATVYQNRLKLRFPQAEQIEYKHRLDLLPGSYRLMFTVDSKTFAYPLEISEKQNMGEIWRADANLDAGERETPFEFAGRQITLNPEGPIAVVSVPQPASVTWIVRQGNQIMWRSKSESDGLATIELPKLAAGAYQLEAFTSNESRNTDLTIPAIAGATAKTTLVSFNANLAPARRLAFLGHQWLLRGDFERARQCLTASIAKGDTPEARIELARTSAMSGNLDGARDQVRGILTARPNDFEALSVFAYIETKFQDYPVAAELYRRALAVQDSPALRMALAKLPTQ